MSVLPEFKKPPLEEVVCGILFEPLKQLLVPHFGLLWEKFKEEYPHFQEMDPLIPLVETATGLRPDDIISSVPLPRIWFLHDDGRIIQVQRDRFHHNWRKVKPNDEYPRYRSVFKMFEDHFNTFTEFLHEHQLGEVIPKQYEMTYVNIIPQGDVWDTLGDTQSLFPDFSWRNTTERFLPNPNAINWQTSFGLPNAAGRLHMNIQTAGRIADKRRLFRLEITARGIGNHTSRANMKDWFELAHEWIVRGFTDYTGTRIQKDVWGRIQ